MDVRTFSEELLRALAGIAFFARVTVQTEGPIAKGYAYVREQLFLRFYFNELTGTSAFALIEKQQRVWGIDYDNRRGWHLHPLEHPEDHVAIAALSIKDIVAQLQDVVFKYGG